MRPLKRQNLSHRPRLPYLFTLYLGPQARVQGPVGSDPLFEDAYTRPGQERIQIWNGFQWKYGSELWWLFALLSVAWQFYGKWPVRCVAPNTLDWKILCSARWPTSNSYPPWICNYCTCTNKLWNSLNADCARGVKSTKECLKIWKQIWEVINIS